MSVTPTTDTPNPQPSDPKGPNVYPFVVLALAVSLAATAGLLAGWPAGVTVLLAVISLLAGGRGGSEK